MKKILILSITLLFLVVACEINWDFALGGESKAERRIAMLEDRIEQLEIDLICDGNDSENRFLRPKTSAYCKKRNNYFKAKQHLINPNVPQEIIDFNNGVYDGYKDGYGSSIEAYWDSKFEFVKPTPSPPMPTPKPRGHMPGTSSESFLD